MLICQGRSCKSLGSAEIFKAFKNYSPTDLDIIGSGCLGQCGNGPMVLVLPQEYWYNRVSKSNVRALVENQLVKGKPVISLLYPVKHSRK